MLHRPCEGTFESVAGVVSRILADRPDTTGFVVHNEGAIQPLLSLLRASGRVVPEDVSVVALCPEALAEQCSPRLTAAHRGHRSGTAHAARPRPRPYPKECEVSTSRLTARLGGLAFGGDYNPEQWDQETWKEDDALMSRARVNLTTLGVFSWALLEPEEGRYEFAWLDQQLDRLHSYGVAVDLATPTASPPPWFTLAHPDAMPITAEGAGLVHGSRDTYCLAAPAYRRAARGIATALAARYGEHPALALWHVHNEYAAVCCDHAAMRLPALAPRAPRQPGGGQRGLGDRLLEPALRQLGGDPAAPGHPVAPQSGPGARLPPLLVRRGPRRLPRAT